MSKNAPAVEFHPYESGTGPSIVNVYGRFKDLRVGDVVVQPWVRAYGHRATMVITKINKKTLKAVEVQGSYGAGTEWTIHESYESLQIDNCRMTIERLAELKELWG